MVLLENLTNESIEICIITYEENQQEKRWRTGYNNDTNGRQRIQEVLADYPDELHKIMDVWGDNPTVIEEPSLIEPHPQPPSLPTETERLRADVDYIAIMTGVEL